MDVVLAARDVVKHFRTTPAVDGISFEVRRGTVTGLLGRNGAGKTTLIRMITGILLPDRGTVEILGSTEGPIPVRDRIGYLPEERGLYKGMKVVDEILFFAEIKGVPPRVAKPRVERWLRRLELWERRDAKVEELSKGNQQKVQLITSLIHDPDLIILDEPMSGLDPVNVVLVRRLFGELRAEGRTLLISTHVMELAETIADEVVLVNEGKVVLAGRVPEVRAAHGRNAIHLEFDGDGAFLGQIPGVAHAAIELHSAELLLEKGGDTQIVLRAAADRLRVHRFDVAAPSLEAIFVAHVGTTSMRPPRDIDAGDRSNGGGS